MDISLDDYMKKKNGGGARGRFGGRRGGIRRPQSSPGESRKPLGVKRGGISPKASVLSRIGRGQGGSRQQTSSDRKFHIKPLEMDKEEQRPVIGSGNLKIVIEDARQRIGKKGGGIQDARLKLTNKSNLSAADARNKIKSKKMDTSKVVTLGRSMSGKTVTIGRPTDDLDDDWSKTIPNLQEHQPDSNKHFGIKRVINQGPPPQIVQPFNDKTDLTIVRNFRPSLATFTVDNNGSSNDVEDNQYEVRITRKVPQSEPVFSLPDYSDLLKDTQRKLDAGLGDMYFGKMQADKESSVTYAKVHKVGHQRTLPVESPMITISNDKSRTDPTGIVALPPRKKAAPPPLPTEEPMDIDAPPPPPPVQSGDMVSPLQGFKVTVSNLHPAVTQEDIIELFASIGALKKARLVKKGSAEVVYVRKEDALSAVKRYHNRLLDNMPMVVKCVASAAQLKVTSSSMTSLTKSKEQKNPIDLDIEVVHKALFKNSREQGSSQPVQFLVKI